jgi:hypothetical protein
MTSRKNNNKYEAPHEAAELGSTTSFLKNEQVLLEEVTPPEYICSYGASCPAIFHNKKTESYVIIGKTISRENPDLRFRISADETAVEIPAGLLDKLLRIRE